MGHLACISVRRPASDFHRFQILKGSFMLKLQTKRLRDRTVVTAAILSLMQCNAYAGGPIGGAHTNDGKTASPIKNVIVIMGENRTFDHVFATYVPLPASTATIFPPRGLSTTT